MVNHNSILEIHRNSLGQLHNDHGPALVTIVSVAYYLNGILTRDGDLPAVTLYNGNVYYYSNGLLHRENDKPAVITDAQIEYWYHGKIHRGNNLPAVFTLSGQEEYWIDGKLIKITHKNINRLISKLTLNHYF